VVQFLQFLNKGCPVSDMVVINIDSGCSLPRNIIV
jgi:hypothetical protein